MPEAVPWTVNCESPADLARREDNVVLFPVVWGQGIYQTMDFLIPLRWALLKFHLARPRGLVLVPARHIAGSKTKLHFDHLRYKWATQKVCCQDKWPHPATHRHSICFETLDNKDKRPNISSWEPCQVLLDWLALKALPMSPGWDKTEMSCLTLTVKKWATLWT